MHLAELGRNINGLMTRTRLALRVITIMLGASSLSPAGQANAKVTLTFISHAGDRANRLQKIAREYTQQTGVEIKAVLPPMRVMTKAPQTGGYAFQFFLRIRPQLHGHTARDRGDEARVYWPHRPNTHA